MIHWTWLSWTLSRRCGRPCDILLTVVQSTLCLFKNSAVPVVARITKSRSSKRRANGRIVGLSASRTLIRTLPWEGSCWPAASWDLAKANPRESSNPITSPVDFISGPSRVSTFSNLSNGNTASFTAQWLTSTSRVSPSSASFMPIITLVAILASGTPVALLTKGIVREARGLTSSIYSSLSLTANWTFIKPITFNSMAMALEASLISSIISDDKVCGGSTQAESPEWMPASSICSMIPPIMVVSPSEMASTSTSMASFRNLSINTGCSEEAIMANPINSLTPCSL